MKTDKTMNSGKTEQKRLYRCEEHKVIAGVAYGLADYFQIDVTLVRLFFIFLAVFNGIGILLYIVLWILIPSEHETERQPFTFENVNNTRQWAGIIFIGLGALILLQSIGLFNNLWPLLLVILGVFLLVRK